MTRGAPPRDSAAAHYVAFLRAINVGGRTVKMTELKAIFERLDLIDVATFIASGNVLFRAPGARRPALERRIEEALRVALGYQVATMLRRSDEVAAIARHDAFEGEQRGGASLYVGFIQGPPAAAAAGKAEGLQTDTDALRVRGTEIYWLARKGFAESSLTGAAIEKALRLPVTFRNITTVARLAAKLEPA